VTLSLSLDLKAKIYKKCPWTPKASELALALKTKTLTALTLALLCLAGTLYLLALLLEASE